MNLAGLARRHSRAIVLVTILVAVAGLIAGFSLPSDIYPPLVFPRIVIIGHSGTAPARSMMLTVTRPLEQALMEVPGIRRVRSRTFRGATEISGQFDPRTDMAVALQQVQSRVAEARTSLPAETELTVERLTPSTFPMLSLNLTGGLSSADLHDYAFYVMRPSLSRVGGVGRVEILSSDTREIEVVADPSKLLAAGLTIPDVAGALRAANQLAPVGRYAAGGQQHLVLASGLWASADQIAQTPVSVKAGPTLRIGDIASVFPGSPDRTNLVTGDGLPAAAVSVSQQLGTNILDVRNGVQHAIADLARSLPAGLRISKTYDLAEFVSTAVANVRDAILIGAILAVFVLLVFLHDWRLTMVAAITLPLTVASTFLFMLIFGESINVMSMGGLAVAIGLVIDDAVVVVENIHRRLAKEQAAVAIDSATAELVAPVVSSTITTVVVFVPLSLLSGVVGQFFRALSLTLSVAVLISLVLALTLIPLLAYATARPGHGDAGSGGGPPSSLEHIYARSVGHIMGRPVVAFVLVVLIAVLGVLLYSKVGTGFLPAADEGGFVIDYLTPSGTALEETDRVISKVEAIVKATPEVAAFSRRTGTELGLFATKQNKGDILVRLKPGSQRTRSAEEIISDLRDKLEQAAPQTEIEFIQLLQDMLGDLEGNPTPIEVKIFGDDPEALAKLADQIDPVLRGVEGVVDIVGAQRGNPESTWEIDPVSAGRMGLSVEQVASQLAAAWLGEVATDLRLLDRTIPVRVRYPDSYRFDPARLEQTTIRGPDGKLAPIGSLGHVTRSNGQSELLRENLRQMALVTARLEGRDLGSAVAEIQSRLAAVTLPVGYTFEVGGQYAAQRQAFQELLLVFGIAAALVFTILVIQFRAFTPASLILAAAPLSLGGAFALLVITETDLNVSSAMGLILLVGLVVKNGIVMLDYAHRLRDEGMAFREAVATAARVRLRPILMTTLCTLFGLLPLALGLGAGAELQKPLALAVIGGLSLSTAVTLYVVPSLYVALAEPRSRPRR